MNKTQQTLSFVIALTALVACTPRATAESSRPETQQEANSPARPHVPTSAEAQSVPGEGIERVMGQTLYVPIYSHIYYQNRRRGRYDLKGHQALNLTVTLSIRNTDLTRSILVTAVRYYDTAGKVVKEYVAQPLSLAPLATTEVIVDERETRGGSGAKFIVEWSAKELATAPIVEAVMVNSSVSYGLAFVSRGRVIRQHKE